MRRALPLLASATVVIACGARSSLIDETAPAPGATSSATGVGGGAPASTSSSGGAPASTSSSGGALPQCPAATVASPVLAIEDPERDARVPNLVALQDAAATVVAVYGAGELGGDANDLRFASLDAWGAWPPALPAPVDVALGGDQARALVAVPRGGAGLATKLSLAYGAMNQGTLLAREVTPTGVMSDTLYLSASLLLSLAPRLYGQAHLGIGWVNRSVFSFDDYFSLDADAALGGAKKPVSRSPGCATTQPTGDAVGDTGGWILGAALGTPFQWAPFTAFCGLDLSSIEPAKRITFARIDATAESATTGDTLDVGAPVSRLRMAPRSDGAWAVYGTEGLVYFATRVSSALEATPPVSIGGAFGAPDPHGFAIGSSGDALVLVDVETLVGGAQAIAVRRFDPQGKPLFSLSIAAEGSVDRDPPALVISPAGDAMLVAWTERAPGAPSYRLRLARVDCVPG
jgi:hypothetical protein